MIEFRTILDPTPCAKWRTGFFGCAVLVTGPLLEGRTVENLFRELVGGGATPPFRFATDGPTVLFGYPSGLAGDGASTRSGDCRPSWPWSAASSSRSSPSGRTPPALPR
ncbi:MAG: hypothetical protein ACREC5_01715 [Thermoplasmata archaeon]